MEKQYIENAIKAYQAVREMPISHCGLLLKGLSSEVETLFKLGFINHIAVRKKEFRVWIDPDVFFGAITKDTNVQEQEFDTFVKFSMEVDGVKYVTYVKKGENNEAV